MSDENNNLDVNSGPEAESTEEVYPGRALHELMEKGPTVAFPTACDLVNEIADDGILHKLADYSLDQLYVFGIYLNVMTGMQLKMAHGELTQTAAILGKFFADTMGALYSVVQARPEIDQKTLREKGALLTPPRSQDMTITKVAPGEESAVDLTLLGIAPSKTVH